MTGTAAPRQPKTAPMRTGAMRKGRQADSARRRQRVIVALNRATSEGTEISVCGIARAAAVDRSFLYRHRDLLAKIHAFEAAPPTADGQAGCHPRLAVSRPARRARTRAPAERAHPATRNPLSGALGEQAWRESGLGAPADAKIEEMAAPLTAAAQRLDEIPGINATIACVILAEIVHYVDQVEERCSCKRVAMPASGVESWTSWVTTTSRSGRSWSGPSAANRKFLTGFGY